MGWRKPACFLLCLWPALLLVWDALHNGLGANPIEALTHRSGEWGLWLLLVTLAVTPVVRLLHWSYLMRLRRMLGLFAFFYLVLHVAVYIGLDHFFAWGEIIEDLVKRPYITLGMLGFLLLVPLAVTSTDRMLRRLGGLRWRRLHSLIYVAVACGILHVLWQAKADSLQLMVYPLLALPLLSYRLSPIRAVCRRATGLIKHILILSLGHRE